MREQLIPIWKDTIFEYTTPAAYVNYQIRYEGGEVFFGRAYKYPDAENVLINVNKLCQDNLSIDFPDLDYAGSYSTYTHPEGFHYFNIYINNSQTPVDTFSFIYNWSYKELPETGITQFDISHPINGKHCTGMYCFHTYFEAELESPTVRTEISRIPSQIYDLMGNRVYDKEGCGEYVLYYLNSYGGWDGFLIEGNVKRVDNYTKYSINRAYNNTTLEFEESTYISQIEDTYALTTGWLTDEQSENLAANLLGSNKVYLHNLKDDSIIPVNITDKSAEHKKYINGHKMVNYTINVAASQKRYRK